MGWSIGYDHIWCRDIGYGVPAYCDFPGCNEEIDRGLSYKCGNDQCDFECNLFLCSNHQYVSYCCDDCTVSAKTKEHPDWIRHKLNDPSWKQWRDENPDEVVRLHNMLVDLSKE